MASSHSLYSWSSPPPPSSSASHASSPSKTDLQTARQQSHQRTLFTVLPIAVLALLLLIPSYYLYETLLYPSTSPWSSTDPSIAYTPLPTIKSSFPRLFHPASNSSTTAYTFLSSHPPAKVHPVNPRSSNITAHNVSCAVPKEPPTLMPPSDLPEVLADYARFHAKARACLLSDSCSPKPPVLIWYCFINYCGGLGDRIRFMRMTTMLAVLTKRVIFLHWPIHDTYDIRVPFTPTYIDWTLPSTDLLDSAMENATLRLVFPLEDGTMEDPLVNSSLPDDVRPRLNLFTSDLTAWIKSFPVVNLNPWMDRKELQRFMRNQYAEPRLKELSYYHLYDLETLFTRFLIRPSAAVSATAQRMGFPLGMDYIGVHVRTGLDYKGADDPSRFAAIQEKMKGTTQKFVECAQRIEKSNGRRNTRTKKRVFVASDSQELKTEFKRLGRRLGMDVRGGTRISWHISIGAPGEIVQDETSRCQAFIETFADAYALGGAKHVVFIESGFPRFGVTMGIVDTWQVLDVETPLNDTNCYTDHMLSLDVLPRGHVEKETDAKSS